MPMLSEELKDRIHQTIHSYPVMLFMKGDKDRPMCKFSMVVTDMLEELGADYQSYNILEDYELRQGIKEYSDWPTFPQLYVNGELIGGADIMIDMYEQGELAEALKTEA